MKVFIAGKAVTRQFLNGRLLSFVVLRSITGV